mmetsp:Transcript_6320/g.13946  ORF Transcript_6320/g.13946 Transcript_6320/m.13946 type:complete len:545 (-) Transcript_6320:1206-2840(-)|eukprot:CAMPEP_0202901198 /NCGR_PEP_ID=MMETSP1392-20130828/13897_1 /ASSEMBLY_ACC=CAM_ASM_000868 /TAXON_ID=225041 /ORGANISM="Chlamydomonas chlamydogama, Strain SAG 11-48b" /LENGTH=544 /DNA_ID=CAMNT_0049587721 /DNA_START=148 /DNA_END=1782 /DNA_ORIENTATION=-
MATTNGEEAKKSLPDLSKTFLKGVAISVWQNSSDNMLSNWTRYAYSLWPFKYLGVRTTMGKHRINKSCEFWDRYREDIKLAHDVGSNTFRFSFEWGRIEPKRGQIDKEAIKRYHEILDALEELGMEPNATLWHFTHPLWFEDLGAFTKEENIALFVEYSRMVFKEFGSRIRLWATFNEPTCYSFLAYIAGMAPPGWIMNLTGSGTALLNILRAHTATYRALKALPGGSAASIGLVHHHITFMAQGNGLLHSLAQYMADWMEYWWGWDVVDHFMQTGEFEWRLPVLGTWIKWKDPQGKPPCDWWGINFYSRVVLSWRLSSSCMMGEVMTDMYYPIYPEGMYKAIVRSSKYGVPMYITETGIADSRDDRRAIMIDTYFKEMLRALAEGYDVRGFYYWTLIDNFEWAAGFTMRFGLYRWEPDGSVDRVLREGSKVLVRFYKTLPDHLPSLREVAKKAQKALGVDMGVDKELEKEGFVLVGGGANGNGTGKTTPAAGRAPGPGTANADVKTSGGPVGDGVEGAVRVPPESKLAKGGQEATLAANYALG